MEWKDRMPGCFGDQDVIFAGHALDEKRAIKKQLMEDNSTLMTLRMRLADLRGRGVYAGYANRHNCIFIHVPKAAGMSITQALFPATAPFSHLSYRRYERANPRKFRRYFKFAFVRNPWDRLVSAYFYMRHAGRVNRFGRVADYDDFASFVRGWLTAANVWSYNLVVPQHYFICDENLQVQMDFVGRVEKIDADFCVVCERLNVKSELIRVNTTDHRHYTEYYTNELREKVASIYANDIATFGYQFES
jgi:hypothetical protein